MALNPEESVALMDQEIGQDVQHTHEYEAQGRQKGTHPNVLWQWISAIFTVFLIVDLVVYLVLYREVLHLFRSIHQADFEFRSPYVGLDDLYNRTGLISASAYAPIVSMPRIVTQVSSIERNKVFPEDEHRYLHKLGTLTPPDRHVLVNNTIHTIVQFRAMDYGMERCALAVRLPSAPSQEWGHNQSAVVAYGTITLCELDVPPNRMLDTQTLSWANRPACQKSLGTSSVTLGEETSLHEFPCAWGTVPAFELSCAPETPDCSLDAWGGSNGQWGLILYQYQTLGQV